MKNKMRFRVAFELCFQEKRFLLSVFEIIIFLCVSIQAIYMIASSGGYKERIEEGTKIPVEQMGYFSFDDFIPEAVTKIRQQPDILYFGSINIGCQNTVGELQFLRELQQGHQKAISDSTYEMFTGIETTVMSADLWDVMNLELTEGKKPYNMPYVESGVLLYLSEDYKDVINVGDVFDVYSSRGELVFKYIVAGFLNRDSAIIDPYAFPMNSEEPGFYLMDYGIIEVPFSEGILDGFFVYRDGADYNDVKNQINSIAAEYGVQAEVYNISSVVQYEEDNARKNTAQLKEIAVIMIVILILSIACTQIYDILTKTKEYGIWLSSGASKKDLVYFIVYQNVIRTVIALIISTIIMQILIHLLYGHNPEMHKIINNVFTKYIYFGELGLGAAVVLFTSVLPAGLIIKNTTINLIKGKIFE